jgi:hypothetical protein
MSAAVFVLPAAGALIGLAIAWNPFTRFMRRRQRDGAAIVGWMADDIDHLRRREKTVTAPGDIAHLGWLGWQLGAHFSDAFEEAHWLRDAREAIERGHLADLRRWAHDDEPGELR